MQLSQKNSLFKTFIQSYLLQNLLGVLLLFACAQIQIPLKPVPITLHTLAVMLIGLTYKPKQSFEIVLSYLLLGAVGAPVFSHLSAGLGVLLGPTGGYLVGFLFAAPLTSWVLTQFSSKSWMVIFISCAAGHIVIYTLGIAWLATLIGFEGAIKGGLLPFILPGLFKTLILASIIKTLRSVLDSRV